MMNPDSDHSRALASSPTEGISISDTALASASGQSDLAPVLTEPCVHQGEHRGEEIISLEKLPDFDAARCIEIGRKMPSMRWWYSTHEKLGCSPRDAVDQGRLNEVEALLP